MDLMTNHVFSAEKEENASCVFCFLNIIITFELKILHKIAEFLFSVFTNIPSPNLTRSVGVFFANNHNEITDGYVVLAMDGRGADGGAVEELAEGDDGTHFAICLSQGLPTTRYRKKVFFRNVYFFQNFAVELSPPSLACAIALQGGRVESELCLGQQSIAKIALGPLV